MDASPQLKPPIGVILCEDLLLASRIYGAGRAGGVEFKTARSEAALLKLIDEHLMPVVIIDLHQPNLNIGELIPSLKSRSVKRIIGFGSHVDVAALDRARAAGCDPVLTRSKLLDVLPNNLANWFASEA